MTRKMPKIYSSAVHDAIVDRIPQKIMEAMISVGWNPEGIYELVAEELKLEKRRKKLEIKK